MNTHKYKDIIAVVGREVKKNYVLTKENGEGNIYYCVLHKEYGEARALANDWRKDYGKRQKGRTDNRYGG